MDTDAYITLTTYGWYDDKSETQHELDFSIPKDWFCRYVHDKLGMTVNEFMLKCTCDDTIDVYGAALKEKVIKEEWEV